MADVKTLNTRIALKYDSYTAWTTAPGKDLVLLAGEIGICEIPGTFTANGDSQVKPTVLFKVGNGTSSFEALPWASAKAADVYNWAKASEVKREGKKLVFVGGVVNADGSRSNLEVPFDYVTLTEVKAITDPLTSRVAKLEADLGLEEGETESISDKIDAINDTLTEIKGEGEGSIKKAVADAVTEVKAYADTAESDAVGTAKSYTDAEVAKDRGRLDDIEALNASQATAISDNATAISTEETNRKAADKAIEDKIGTLPTGDDGYATIVAGIAAAKKAGTDAADAVTTLTNGAVKPNTTNIATNAAAISALQEALEAETEAREGADSGIDTRLVAVEAFFKTAEGETLDTALDTLVEIQDYLNGEGSATGGIIDRVAANEQAIEALETTLAKDGDFEKRVASTESTVAQLVTDLDTAEDTVADLVDVTEGYTAKGSIKTAVDAAKAQADKGVEDAATAQTGVNTLTGIVGSTAQEGLRKAVADNASNISAIAGDYLKAADLFIIDCGSASTVIHTKP